MTNTRWSNLCRIKRAEALDTMSTDEFLAWCLEFQPYHKDRMSGAAMDQYFDLLLKARALIRYYRGASSHDSIATFAAGLSEEEAAELEVVAK